MPARSAASHPIAALPPFDDDGHLHVVVDTPRGSHNKFEYDAELGLFRLGGVLPAGAFFPFDFGFVPSTLGGDGDPLDVLVLLDEPTFVGCLVGARLLGVIEAEQQEGEKPVQRNDRLIAVAVDSRRHKGVRSLTDLGELLLDEIEHFFVSYNEAKGKLFRPLARAGATRARTIVRDGVTNAKRGKARAGRSRRRR